MKNIFIISTFISIAVFNQYAVADELPKYQNKHIEELSNMPFRYSNINGKQSLTPISSKDVEAAQKVYFQTQGKGDKSRYIAQLRSPGEAIEIPKTSLILAFLKCPFFADGCGASVVAFFDSKKINVPLCVSYIDLMDKSSSYYWGSIKSLEIRETDNNSYFVIVKMSGGDAGDSWMSLAFLHISTTCQLTLLSKLYAYLGYDLADEALGNCQGKKLEYRFLNDSVVEVCTKDIKCLGFNKDGDYIESNIKTTREKFDLKALYSNPKIRIIKP